MARKCKKRLGSTAFLPFCLFALFLFSCQADNEYSSEPCRFVYDNSINQDAALASAMVYESRGIFCRVTESTWGGVKYINFQTNNELQTEPHRESTPELQANFILGVNNGIIVGFQTMNQQPYGGFVGYDAQCPNCMRRENNYLNPKFSVSMSESGIATCPKCGKRYDLNNGGIVQNGEEGDTGLLKYVATTTGPYGVVSVHSR